MMGPDAGVRVDVFRMSQDEIEVFLEQRLLARLATFAPSGDMHVVPMWYRRDGSSIIIPTSLHTRKVSHLRDHPLASVTIDQYRNGSAIRGVFISGHASIVTGEEGLRLNRSIHLRYVSEESLAGGPLAEYLSGDDVTIAIEMARTRSWKVSATEPHDFPAEAFLPLDF
jgi:nitroimidazol reductase NimA-like FMN-containing flavoprotein (pyridoxamine 5'-phosphate oxidase superfamily)